VEILTPSLDDISRYLELTGKRGTQTLSILGRYFPFVQSVLGTEVGREILKDDVDRVEELLLKVIKEEETDLERAELRYLRDVRMPKVIKKVKLYLEAIKEIGKVKS